ncbi:MAG: flagellar hook-length control protein FliK, partial [Myxococcota bacterium]|nr:flagellar hook-length control protein FliK [Myxococcota bacterium]
TEETQTVLKLNNGNAGKIEVRLRMDGRDLTVQMKADDVEGRQKMLEALPELRRELAKAQLVAGRVDITEFGHAEFDLNGEGQSFDQEDAEDTGAEMSGDQKGSSPGRSGGSVDTTVTSGTQSRDDGRLHVVV